MKRIFALTTVIAVFIACLYLFGCANINKNGKPSESSVTETTTELKTTQLQTAEPSEKQTEKTNPVKGSSTDVGGGTILQDKYRQCYYQIFYQLAILVDQKELEEWEDQAYAQDLNETNEMLVKQFVQHFNISKEDFERANLELTKVLYEPGSETTMSPKDYVNQEMYEIYNADIIYTFDDEIINEYYLSPEYPFLYPFEYEQALENGTYQTRTTDWIIPEELEAEINAKYGAPDEADLTTSLPIKTEE